MKYSSYIAHMADVKSLYPDLFRELRKYEGQSDIFVHFTNMPQLKFNFRQNVGRNEPGVWRTPFGIYFFPLEYVLNDDHFKQNTFFLGRPFVYVVRVKEGNYLDLGSLTKEDVLKMAEEVLKNDPEAIEAYQKDIVEKERMNYEQVPAEGFMNFIRDRYSNILSAPLLYKIFKNLGYDGLIDQGSGAVHSNEPYQAVFFSSNQYEILERIDVPTSKLVTNPSLISDYGRMDKNTRRKEYRTSYNVIKKHHYQIFEKACDRLLDQDGRSNITSNQSGSFSKSLSMRGRYQGNPVKISVSMIYPSDMDSSEFTSLSGDIFFTFLSMSSKNSLKENFRYSIYSNETLDSEIYKSIENIVSGIHIDNFRESKLPILKQMANVIRGMGFDGKITNEDEWDENVTIKDNLSKIAKNGEKVISINYHNYGKEYSLQMFCRYSDVLSWHSNLRIISESSDLPSDQLEGDIVNGTIKLFNETKRKLSEALEINYGPSTWDRTDYSWQYEKIYNIFKEMIDNG